MKFLSRTFAVIAVTFIAMFFYIGLLPIVLIILADSIRTKDNRGWARE